MIDAAIKFMGPIGGVMLTALGGLDFCKQMECYMVRFIY